MDKVGMSEQIDVVKRKTDDKVTILKAEIERLQQENTDIEALRAEAVEAIGKAYAAITHTKEWKAWNQLSQRIRSFDAMQSRNRKEIKRTREGIGKLTKGE